MLGFTASVRVKAIRVVVSVRFSVSVGIVVRLRFGIGCGVRLGVSVRVSGP